MPRADPTRSDYCASRHLLRNLDSAAELRRNPLVRGYFASGGDRRASGGDRIALGLICEDVRVALARCSEFAHDCTHVGLARMHAALLRCDIDDKPMPAVAAELGLSERQLRRERHAAHAAFARAFRALRRGCDMRATVCDVAAVRVAEAVTLHELGQGAVAQSALASIASGAVDPAQRIEALCLGAELEFDALRHVAAAEHLAAARLLTGRYAREVDDDAARTADEHVEFVAWLLRWQTATCTGLTAPAPVILRGRGDARARSERHRSLFVRAAAAYGEQRCEVGDGANGRAAVARGWDVMWTLDRARVKERLALMMADAHVFGFGAPRGADRHQLRVVERRAAAHGHVRTHLIARAERIASETAAAPVKTARISGPILKPFGAGERRSLARAFALAAESAAGLESNKRQVVELSNLVSSLLPPRSGGGLTVRYFIANTIIAARSFDEAEPLAQIIYSDAKAAGNHRVLAAAARALSIIATGCRRRTEAQRYIREALTLSERFASPAALALTMGFARRLDVA
jgi:hypothetical protein